MEVEWNGRSPLLQAYIFRKVAVPTLLVTAVLTGVLSLERVLRLVERVTNEGLPTSLAFGLAGYLLPHYVGLALPIGLLLGTLHGVRKLHDRSELVVMRTFGMPARRMLRPVFLLVALYGLVAVVLSGLVQPHARHAFRERVHALVEERDRIEVVPGVFRRFEEGAMFRAREVTRAGRDFSEVFIAFESPESRLFLTAEEGAFTRRDGRRVLLLRNGAGLTERATGGGAMAFEGTLEFGELSMPLGPPDEPFPPRGQDEREMTLAELWRGEPAPEATPGAVRAEWHARLAKVAVLPVFGVLAFPLALIGRGRGARAWGYGIALVLFVVYEKSSEVGATLVESGRLTPWIGVWGPWAGLVALVGALFHHYSGDRGRSVFGAMASVWPQSVSRWEKKGGGR